MNSHITIGANKVPVTVDLVIAHLTIEAINHYDSKPNATLNKFQQEMQDYYDTADAIVKPTSNVETADAECKHLSRYKANIQFLDHDAKEALDANIQKGVENIREAGNAHYAPPASSDYVEYDAPEREKGKIYSVTYFLSSKQDAELFFDALEHTAITLDNKEAIDIWRGIIDRDEHAFGRVA